jgi:hypothetical protein
MKKIVLTLALVAGLTSFTRTVMAQSVISTYNVSMNSSVNKFLTFTPPTTTSISSSYNTNSIYVGGGYTGQTGYFFQSIAYQTSASYGVCAYQVALGSTINSSLYFITPGGNGVSGTFTGTRYEPIEMISGADKYFGYIQFTGNGTSSWILNSVTWGTTANTAITVVDTTAAPVPEPSTYALLGMGVLGMRMAMRRKKMA